MRRYHEPCGDGRPRLSGGAKRRLSVPEGRELWWKDWQLNRQGPSTALAALRSGRDDSD